MYAKNTDEAVGGLRGGRLRNSGEPFAGETRGNRAPGETVSPEKPSLRKNL